MRACVLQWANLTGMQAIDLSSNNLTGTLPGEWASMTQLRELRLSSNRFTVSLPDIHKGCVLCLRVGHTLT